MAHRRPLGSGSAADPIFGLDSDLEEESLVVPRKGFARTRGVIDLTSSPQRDVRPVLPMTTLPEFRNIPQRESRQPAAPAVPTPPKALESTIHHSSGPEIRVSPPSTRKTRQATPEIESEEEDAHIHSQENGPASPDTPSKRSSPRSLRRSRQSTDYSIGSTSPLVTRIQGRKFQKLVLNSDEIVDALKGFEQRVRDDHALTVRWTLPNPKEFTPITTFDSKESPFSSMKGIQLQPGDRVPVGAVMQTVDHWSFGGRSNKPNKSQSVLIGKRASTAGPRVPKYYSHTNVRRNILSADNETLKYIPYLGDTTDTKDTQKRDRMVEELVEAYSASRLESSRKSEQAFRLRAYIDLWLDELKIGCDQEDLRRYILEREDGDDFELNRRDRKMILKSFKEKLALDVEKNAGNFSEAFKVVFDIPLHKVILPRDRLKEMVLSSRKAAFRTPEKPEENSTDKLGTYTTLTCMICGAVDCPTHGAHEALTVTRSDDSDNDNSEEEEPEYVYETQRVVLEYDAILRRYNIRNSNKPAPEPEPERSIRPQKECSQDCYNAVDSSEREYEWRQEDIDAIPQKLITLTNKDYRSCDISFALGLPCWQVDVEIRDYEDRNEAVTNFEQPQHSRAKGPTWYDNKRKTLRGDWMDMTKAHLHQERSQANPCMHDGPCSAGKCSCFDLNLLCESFCCCPEDCPRKFTGCGCILSGNACCVSESCICIQMNRECGPECGSCGAVDRINPANRNDDDLFKTGCQNIVLQRGVSKKLVIGESQLVGFGLYTAETVQKGEYLGEYAGEVISTTEAERRGIIYDKKFLSFLFDLNKEWVIDAARYGNKTRFINHAADAEDGLNCEARIVLVNGEHRIKFVALRDIEVGEELLFNYGKKFAEKHGLSKRLPKAKAKEGGKKGVLVSEEALDALDRIDSKKRDTRKKLMAIKEGAGNGTKGKRTRKAGAKEAPNRDVDLMEGVITEDDSQKMIQEDDSEDDEDIARENRGKRKITRPARYTR